MEIDILEETTALTTALERGDAVAAGELYVDDARLLASSGEPLHGRGEIEAYWRAGVELGLSGISFESHVLERIEGGTLELGRYVVSLDGGSSRAVERGSYLVLHQTYDGSWRRAVEVFNPDGPASARRSSCKEEG